MSVRPAPADARSSCTARAGKIRAAGSRRSGPRRPPRARRSGIKKGRPGRRPRARGQIPVTCRASSARPAAARVGGRRRAAYARLWLARRPTAAASRRSGGPRVARREPKTGTRAGRLAARCTRPAAYRAPPARAPSFGQKGHWVAPKQQPVRCGSRPLVIALNGAPAPGPHTPRGAVPPSRGFGGGELTPTTPPPRRRRQSPETRARLTFVCAPRMACRGSSFASRCSRSLCAPKVSHIMTDWPEDSRSGR